MRSATLYLIPLLAALVSAVPRNANTKRATLPIPASQGSETFAQPQIIAAGETFDGGMRIYGRGLECNGQNEGGKADTVFILEDGATLKNAIIGPDQSEGVYCNGPCTIENVWWEAVCEDALSIKGNGDAMIIGGGATHADDKVVQHNGIGTVTIDGFTVVDFGKLYRSCGNCKNKESDASRRNVIIKNVKAYEGKELSGINSNFGDTAVISNTCARDVKNICTEYTGNTTGKEPKKIGSGSSNACQYDVVPEC